MRCSGAMSAKCNGLDIQPVDLGIAKMMKGVLMCSACREVAARFGMIDRRIGERRSPRRAVPGRRS